MNSCLPLEPSLPGPLVGAASGGLAASGSPLVEPLLLPPLLLPLSPGVGARDQGHAGDCADQVTVHRVSPLSNDQTISANLRTQALVRLAASGDE
jgi:hypothetical protein